jgi:small subunit ribosomal protein S7
MTASSSQLKPDPRFHSILASKFINCLMHDGKKTTAQRVFYDAMDLIAGKISDKPPIEVFHEAVDNVKPSIEVRSRRVGGANYQVPVEVRPERRQALAFRWIVGFARARNEKSFAEKLGAEVIAASKNEGSSVRKKEDTHRMAEANKAFAHYRW